MTYDILLSDRCKFFVNPLCRILLLVSHDEHPGHPAVVPVLFLRGTTKR